MELKIKICIMLALLIISCIGAAKAGSAYQIYWLVGYVTGGVFMLSLNWIYNDEKYQELFEVEGLDR